MHRFVLLKDRAGLGPRSQERRRRWSKSASFHPAVCPTWSRNARFPVVERDLPWVGASIGRGKAFCTGSMLCYHSCHLWSAQTRGETASDLKCDRSANLVEVTEIWRGNSPTLQSLEPVQNQNMHIYSPPRPPPPLLARFLSPCCFFILSRAAFSDFFLHQEKSVTVFVKTMVLASHLLKLSAVKGVENLFLVAFARLSC